MTTNNEKTEVVGFRVSKRVLTRARRMLASGGEKVGDIARLAFLREVERRERKQGAGVTSGS